MRMIEPRPALTVLLVEDDPSEEGLVRRLLGECALATRLVVHAHGLEEGLRRIRTETFSILLLNLASPSGVGSNDIARVREAAPGLPIVVLADLHDNRPAFDAVGCGADDCLCKTHLDPVTLEKSIAYALSRSETMSALRQSEQRYALALQGANDGIWDWRFEPASVNYSDRWKMMLGWEGNELSDSPEEWFGRVHPEDLDQVQLELEQHFRGQAEHFEAEYRMRHKDGTYRWILGRGLALRDDAGVAYRMAGSHTDVTARKEAEALLVHRAYHDRTTGLANRTLFLDQLRQAMSRAERDATRVFALLTLDIDRFRAISDSYGHRAGDLLLKTMGERLAQQVRGHDTLARIGDGQFAVLVDDVCDMREAMQVAERLQRETRRPFDLLGHEVFADVSVGITTSETARKCPEDHLQDADIAMHRAKTLGDSVPAVFDVDMYERVVARLQLETELRTALEKDELLVHYQPIVDFRGPQVVGFEALLRWNHPSRGCLAAGEFISVVEETGMLPAIFQRVLPLVAAQVAQWNTEAPGAPPIFVNVNLSPRQLSDPRTLQDIDDALTTYGLAGSGLGVEITESTITQDTDAARAMLHAMSARGLRLDLDDFGTGYSSLSCLHSFPIDGLKIDRSFVAELSSSPRQRKICQAIVGLARTLGLRVTAEGIENPEQLQQVVDLGCDHGQGWYLGMPMDATEATTLLCARGQQRRGVA